MSENKLVYSTDSLEHKMNFDEKEKNFDTLGMYQDKDGTYCIKEELMWNGEFDEM